MDPIVLEGKLTNFKNQSWYLLKELDKLPANYLYPLWFFYFFFSFSYFFYSLNFF